MEVLYLVLFFLAGVALCALLLFAIAMLSRDRWRRTLVYFGLASWPDELRPRRRG